MKTALRTVALCLLLSHARGFANDNWTEFATKAVNAAVPTLAAIWVACRALDVAHYVADKTADNVSETAGNFLGKVVDVVDPRVSLQDAFGCDNRSK
jgi:hypothetical protein